MIVARDDFVHARFAQLTHGVNLRHSNTSARRQRRVKDIGGFDAFISYSHASSPSLATELHRLIRRVGLKWYKPSPLRLFRDTTNLSASPSLWEDIRFALDSSRHFVLLASPKAAQSRWVRREINHWRARHDSKTFFIVQTAGSIKYSPEIGDFDWKQTSALPQCLSGYFLDEPVWVDVRGAERVGVRRGQRNDRLRDAARTIAAAIYGVSKDSLEGEDERESERAVRTLQFGVAALVVLTVAALIASILAIVSQQTAENQARVSLSRQLAQLAINQTDSDVDVANLLAVAAFRTDQNSQSRAALMQTATRNGRLQRYLPFPAPVARLAGSSGGNAVVAGLSDGRVYKWDLSEGAPKEIMRLHSTIATIAVDRTGRTIVAGDGQQAYISVEGSAPMPLPSPPGLEPTAVGVSPTGQTAVVVSTKYGQKSILRVFSASDFSHVVSTEVASSPLGISIPVTDDQLLLLDGYGSWERRRLADLSLIDASNVNFGAHSYAIAASADATATSSTNAALRLSVWRTTGPSDYDTPAGIGYAPISHPTALALDPTGANIAVADSNSIYVSPVVDPAKPNPDPIVLQGGGRANLEALQFFGSGRRLLSATGNRIILWSLDQIDRLGQSYQIPISYDTCGACGGPEISVAPDNSAVAAIEEDGTFAAVYPMDSPARPLVLPAGERFQNPVWIPGSGEVDVLGSEETSRVLKVDPSHRVRIIPGGSLVVPYLSVELASDQNTLTALDHDGTVERIDRLSGAVRSTVSLRTSPSETLVGGTMSPGGDYAALQFTDRLEIRDVNSTARLATITASDIVGATFLDDELYVDRSDGTVEAWDSLGRTLLRRFPSSGGTISPSELILARQEDDSSFVLSDFSNGATLVRIPAPEDLPGERSSLAFSNDGSRLVVMTEGSENDFGRLTIRDIDDEALVRGACAVAGRNLDQIEWDRLVGAGSVTKNYC